MEKRVGWVIYERNVTHIRDQRGTKEGRIEGTTWAGGKKEERERGRHRDTETGRERETWGGWGEREGEREREREGEREGEREKERKKPPR
jgi:hypothetical protein